MNMDYEQKYKEALETIQEILNSGSDSIKMPRLKLRLQSVFSELQESEDDRIINNIKKAVESYWSDEPLHEILAWLEKQGKNNMGISEAIKQKLEDNLNKALEKETPESYNEFLDKQGEQKPAIKLERDDNGEAVLTPFEAELFSMMSEAWQGYSFGEEVNIAKIVKEHSKELLERANEQKSAWSEEDEYCLAGAIETELYMLDVVNGVKKFDVGNSSIKEECTRELDWLKSLKERVQPQPKQEWSKDDDQYLLVCKNALKKYQITDKWDAHIISQWLEDKLKSLRPQTTWKPSDEQMQALCSKLPLLTGSGNEVQRVLETLYCDLKKLRNE